jgi:hypothetical protein
MRLPSIEIVVFLPMTCGGGSRAGRDLRQNVGRTVNFVACGNDIAVTDKLLNTTLVIPVPRTKNVSH